MGTTISEIVHSKVFAGAVSGALAAAAVDYHAFRSFKNWDEFVAYKWGTAAFRWLQGAVAGAVGSSALGAILG